MELWSAFLFIRSRARDVDFIMLQHVSVVDMHVRGVFLLICGGARSGPSFHQCRVGQCWSPAED